MQVYGIRKYKRSALLVWIQIVLTCLSLENPAHATVGVPPNVQINEVI